MAAGSTYSTIATTTLGSDIASYTFSSIGGTYTDLILIGQFGQSTGGNAIAVQFNSDTGTNYSFTALVGSGTAASSTRVSNSNYLYPAYNIAPSSAIAGVLKMNIQNYSNTTTNKSVLIRYDNNDATYPGTSTTVGLWRSTSAITSIKIEAFGGTGLKTNSTFTLYGITCA